jgi:hypothetical protein
MRRRGAWIFAGLILTAALLASPLDDAREPLGIAASSPAKGATIAESLRSGGVDVDGVVVQRGRRNYAGPRCPGTGWNCTKARTVVQIAPDGGKNRFECRTGDSRTDSSTEGRCFVIQQFSSGGGENDARCIQRAEQVAGARQKAAQSCEINQTNATGANSAAVRQLISQVTTRSPQIAQQHADVTQLNDSGPNESDTVQEVEQVAKTEGPRVKHVQDSRQAAALHQDAATGTNLERLQQSLTQNGEIERSSGRGSSSSQLQDAALLGDVRQESAAVSRSFNRQEADQRLDAPPGTTQVQDPRSRCCTSQTDNPDNVFTIDQRFVQLASSPTSQLGYEIGECFTTGNCTITQRARQNDQRQTNSASDTGFVTATIVCEGVGRANECTTEGIEPVS